MFVLVIVAGALCHAAADYPVQIKAYLPSLPRPEIIYQTPDIDTFPPLFEGDPGGSFGQWSFTLLSLAGLAALQAKENGGKELLWIHSPGIVSYTIILEDIIRRTGVKIVPLTELESIVQLGIDKGWIKGYITYCSDESHRGFYDAIDPEDTAYNNSANVATSLASHLGGIIVNARAEPFFQRMGLTQILDTRDKDERWCFEHFRHVFSKKLIHLLDPKTPHMRDYAIATRSLCVFGTTPLVGEILQWLEPNAPAMGWNAGDEFKHVAQLSRFAHFTTASNWIMNLPVMSCIQVGVDSSWEELQVNCKSQIDPLALDWPEDVHFTSFVLSDGDNVQWFLGEFAGHPHAYWRAESRGTFPFGWTMPVSHLSQVGVSLLAHLARTATLNDHVITFPSGYYYPDHYGQGLSGDKDYYRERVAMFANRLGQLQTRIVINIAERWDGEGALRAYKTFAEDIPELVGILAMQYHPYNAGLGALQWVENKSGIPIPVVTPRFSIWSGLGHQNNIGPPALIAQKINAQAWQRFASSEEYFDWTIVHAWSWFVKADTTQTILAEEIGDRKELPQHAVVRNGFEPAAWCVQRLAPHVRVVSPEELLWRIRLQLKTRQTLLGLAEQLTRLDETPAWQKQIVEQFIERLMRSTLESPEQCRNAFYWLKKIYFGHILPSDSMPEDLGTEGRS